MTVTYDSVNNKITISNETDLESVITQSPVTDIDLGDYHIVEIGSNVLEVSGTVSWSPLSYLLAFNSQQDTSVGGAERDHDIHVVSGGALTIDASYTVNGEKIYRRSMVYKSRRPRPSGGGAAHILNTSGSSFFVDNGGTVNLTGGAYIIRHNLSLGAGATANLEGVYLKGEGNRMFFDVGSVSDCLNCTFEHWSPYFNTFPTRLEGCTFLNCNAIRSERGWHLGMSQSPDIILSPVWQATSNSISAIWSGAWLRTRNSAEGSSLGIQDTGNTNLIMYGVCDFTQEVLFKTSDVSGNAVDGFIFKAVESDDGGRVNLNDTSGVGANFNNTDIRSMTWTTDGTGTSNSIEVRLYALAKVQHSSSSSATRYSNSADDVYNVYGYKYGFGFIYKSYTFRASGQLEISEISLEDTLITESDKSVVDAYPFSVSLSGSTWTITGDNTTLQSITSFQIYDAIASYMEDNFTNSDIRIGRAAKELNFGALNVVLDYITLDGTIETTGTVTLSNGSSASGIVDTTADSFLSFSGISSWIVYPTESDRDANTNASGNGTGSQTFRFNYVASTIYYLRLTTSAGETIFKQTTPTQSGETNVSLETTSLLSSVNKALGYNEPKIYVNTTLSANGDGTASSKFNNIDDAVNLYKQGGFIEIILTADPSNIATLGVNADHVIIRGTSQDSYLNINGQSLQGSTISNVSIYGTQNLLNTTTYYAGCAVRGDSDFVGKLENCGFYGDGTNALTVAFHGSVELIECRSSNVQDTTFDFTNALGVISHDWKGGQHKIDNLTGSKLYTLYADRGECVINASSTGGFVTVNDMVVTTDNGTSTVLNSNTTEVKSDTIIEDTNELQTNQGQWVTATGFATPTNVSNAQTAIIAEVQQSEADVIAALPTPDEMTEAELHSALDSYANKDNWKADVSSLSADVNVVEVNGVAVTNIDDFKADVSNLSADVNVVQVAGANITSINDFKADISNLALEATVNALNNLSSADITSAVPTAAQIAIAVEAALINEGDGQQLIDAILQVINSNLDLPALEIQAIAQAVRTELSSELGDIGIAKDHAAAANIQTKKT